MEIVNFAEQKQTETSRRAQKISNLAFIRRFRVNTVLAAADIDFHISGITKDLSILPSPGLNFALFPNKNNWIDR